MKKSQWVMVWLLPVIVIGGIFYPLLGFLVLAMMATLLITSVFAGRYWCWNLCPRGAFLDIVMSRLSLNRLFPGILVKDWFRFLILVLLMGFLSWRLLSSGWNPVAVGAVFVIMCLATTVIAIFLGIFTRHRAWCVICPMGFLQEKIGKVSELNNSRRQI
jgi:polyferredoxin